MTRKRKIVAIVLTVLLICNLCFIWGNSIAGKDTSLNLSLEVLRFVPSFIQRLAPDPDTLVYIIRKLAHFSEFACLGGLSTGLLLASSKLGLHPVLHLLSGGFFVAAIDETIQIFSNRGSQLQDVWLDFSGFTVGLLIVLGVWTVFCHFKSVPNSSTHVIPFPKNHSQRKNSSK